MTFMADDVSGIKVAHRDEKESADLVSEDGNLVVDWLLVRIEEEGKKSRSEKIEMNQRKGEPNRVVRTGIDLPRAPQFESPRDRPSSRLGLLMKLLAPG